VGGGDGNNYKDNIWRPPHGNKKLRGDRTIQLGVDSSYLVRVQTTKKPFLVNEMGQGWGFGGGFVWGGKPTPGVEKH